VGLTPRRIHWLTSVVTWHRLQFCGLRPEKGYAGYAQQKLKTTRLLIREGAPMTYGIQLWGCAKPSNTKIIQRLQSNVLRTITNVPWYVSSFTLHSDLQIPFITEEIKRYSTIYYNRLIGHKNSYVTELSNPLNVRRRLKRQWPSDLKDQREEEE
jgi:hypothetical protein